MARRAGGTQRGKRREVGTQESATDSVGMPASSIRALITDSLVLLDQSCGASSSGGRSRRRGRRGRAADRRDTLWWRVTLQDTRGGG